MQDNGVQTLSDHEAREALERFVMENDELLDLEARIGRFNIFDALGMVNAEIRHSNFLGWLLDPAESHGAGDLFLKAIVMDMLRETAEDLRPKGVSPIDLDGAQIASVDIRREWKNIDLLIHCESPKLVIAIENKIRSGEHGGQLSRYKQIVRDAFPDEPAMFVFLTREGDDPSDEDWTTYSYAEIKRVLERVRRANEGAIGDDVATFLDHYLHLIESQLMEDEVMDELCRKIYKNHRQAIDLLIRFVSSEQPRRLCGVDALLEARPDSLRVLPGYRKAHAFVPIAVYNALPAIGKYEHLGQNSWLVWKVDIWKNKARLLVELWDTTDRDLRRTVFNALTDPTHALGFKVSNRARAGIDRLLEKGSALRLSSQNLYTLTESPEQDSDAIQDALSYQLKKLLAQSERIASVIRAAADAHRV